MRTPLLLRTFLYPILFPIIADINDVTDFHPPAYLGIIQDGYFSCTVNQAHEKVWARVTF